MMMDSLPEVNVVYQKPDLYSFSDARGAAQLPFARKGDDGG